MRHLFLCVDCGTEFEKVDAGVLCKDCRNKPVEEPVSEVAKPKAPKKTPKKKGSE